MRFLIRLYREYPRQVFRLPRIEEGETARMLSVLLVVRSDLQRCGHQAVRIIDRALPDHIRRALNEDAGAP